MKIKNLLLTSTVLLLVSNAASAQYLSSCYTGHGTFRLMDRNGGNYAFIDTHRKSVGLSKFGFKLNYKTRNNYDGLCIRGNYKITTYYGNNFNIKKEERIIHDSDGPVYIPNGFMANGVPDDENYRINSDRYPMLTVRSVAFEEIIDPPTFNSWQQNGWTNKGDLFSYDNPYNEKRDLFISWISGPYGYFPTNQGSNRSFGFAGQSPIFEISIDYVN
ncbi:TPA: hypothetical protein ACX6RV_001370 [Photobacterium damselae]